MSAWSGPGAAELARYRGALDAVLAWSRARDYRGFSKHDALASPLLATLFGWGKWPRILAIQGVMRAPVDVRPWLGVPRRRDPKGIALFARAGLDLWAIDGVESHLRAATELLDWLLAHPARGFRGLSWGYPYPWQDLGFFAPTDSPNRVVTSWVGLALAEAARATGLARYRDALAPIAEFLLEEPKVLFAGAEGKCLSYVPDPAITMAVMDVPALAGAFLAEAAAIAGRDEWATEARKLIAWVADKQTAYGAWYYTHPPGDSPVTHDNYHTAIILDCLDQYRVATGDVAFDEVYRRGLGYYRKHLFEDDGAPRWRNDRAFPRDVHGAASGILCFARAGARAAEHARFATTILDWTLQHLFDPSGFFYYQKTRFYTKRFCLLRWGNGWMARALASGVRQAASPDLRWRG